MSTRSATQPAAIYDSIVAAAKFKNVLKKKKTCNSKYGNPHVIQGANYIHRSPTWQIQHFLPRFNKKHNKYFYTWSTLAQPFFSPPPKKYYSFYPSSFHFSDFHVFPFTPASFLPSQVLWRRRGFSSQHSMIFPTEIYSVRCITVNDRIQKTKRTTFHVGC